MTVHTPNARGRGRYERVKRVADVAVAGTALAASLPLQGLVAGAVRLKLGSPVLFRQTRPGLNGRPFEMYKFRTMLTPEQAGGRSGDADRLTPFGAWLRSTSLDELPALWNVVRGDMSVVGPRPLLMHYLDHYSERQARRHEVRPGLTGLAQVSGRNTISWDERLELDAAYVDRMSPRMDFEILLRTVAVVLGRGGVSAPGEATMAPFAPMPKHASSLSFTGGVAR